MPCDVGILIQAETTRRLRKAKEGGRKVRAGRFSMKVPNQLGAQTEGRGGRRGGWIESRQKKKQNAEPSESLKSGWGLGGKTGKAAGSREKEQRDRASKRHNRRSEGRSVRDRRGTDRRRCWRKNAELFSGRSPSGWKMSADIHAGSSSYLKSERV